MLLFDYKKTDDKFKIRAKTPVLHPRALAKNFYRLMSEPLLEWEVTYEATVLNHEHIRIYRDVVAKSVLMQKHKQRIHKACLFNSTFNTIHPTGGGILRVREFRELSKLETSNGN